MNVSLL